MVNSIFLGINIDQVAMLRDQRGKRYPDPVMVALVASQAGADHVSLYLKEGQSDIQDRDLILLKGMAQTPINLEVAPNEAMLSLAEHLKPEYVCFVSDEREKGLDIAEDFEYIKNACHRLLDKDIEVSLLIEPDCKQIELAKETGAQAVEMHTGRYAHILSPHAQKMELSILEKAVKFAQAMGLQVHAGYGLDYHNVSSVACIKEISRLNIGHAIIAQAIFTGLESAVKEMKSLIKEARLL